MSDQANDLRELVRRASAAALPDAATPRPKLIVVSGGKGGVGTTTLAVNLAVVLALDGNRTALIDADPNGGDTNPLVDGGHSWTIADVISGRSNVAQSLRGGPHGVEILPGAWATDQLAEASPNDQKRLLEELQALGTHADLIVVDAGNGFGQLARRLWHAADLILPVTTAEPNAVMDTYASIKVLAAGSDAVPLRPVVNRAASAIEADEVQSRLARASLRFLGIHLQPGGHIESNPEIAAGGLLGEPVAANDDSVSARQFRSVATTVTQAIQHTFSTTSPLGSPQWSHD